MKPGLKFVPLIGKIAIPESAKLNLNPLRALQKYGRRGLRFVCSAVRRAEHNPCDIKLNAFIQPTEKCPSGTNFDIIRVCA